VSVVFTYLSTSWHFIYFKVPVWS